MLVDCPDFEAILGNRQHLVAARDLLHLDGVERSTVADQLMVNLMCASHEILNVGGLWIDSFCPIGAQLNGLVEDQRNDLIALNPRLRFTAAEAAYIRSRPTMNADEAAELL